MVVGMASFTVKCFVSFVNNVRLTVASQSSKQLNIVNQRTRCAGITWRL